MPLSFSHSIGIIGGGVIGLSIGWQLQRNGAAIRLFDRSLLERSTSYIAAGMLAPHAEAGPHDIELMKLGRESLENYPRFLEQLRSDCGHAPRLNVCGTLWVGTDGDDQRYLERSVAMKRESGSQARKLTKEEAQRKVPGLSDDISYAAWMPYDAQINNRTLIRDLVMAILEREGEVNENTPVMKAYKEERKWKVRTSSSEYEFDEVIWAGGSETPMEGIRKVKGQIIQLKSRAVIPPETMIRTPRVYIVPKGSDSVLVGATMEEVPDECNTVGGVKELLEEAESVFPDIRKMVYHRAEFGFRPAFHNDLPFIGRKDPNEVYHATGHYRHGILLAPYTAYRVVNEMFPERKGAKRKSPN